MNRSVVICVTPVKNEVWILERFLKCASLWADYIVVADQGSDDGSREIAAKFDKVVLIDNPSAAFNEAERQILLLEAARKIPGRRLIIALDADEFLTANFLTSPEWDTILQAPVGTVFAFQYPMILSDVVSYWLWPAEVTFGFMDDGSPHYPKPIHSTRVPVLKGVHRISARDIKVMHYAYTDPKRVESRVRWYQCWETLHMPQRRPMDLYRFYYKYHVPPSQIKRMPKAWLQGYADRQIDMTTIHSPDVYRWDKEIVQLFAEHGVERFKRLAIWDVDWARVLHAMNSATPPTKVKDPRRKIVKLVHRWLLFTRPYFSYYGPNVPWCLRPCLYLVDRLLRAAGW